MKIDNPFVAALKTYRQIISSTVVFSIAINALMFVSPLYMLQVYDRVLHSRNEMTLVMITGIALLLLLIYSLLEWLRSRVLVRAGLCFDDMVSKGLLAGSSPAPSGNRKPGRSSLSPIWIDFATSSPARV